MYLFWSNILTLILYSPHNKIWSFEFIQTSITHHMVLEIIIYILAIPIKGKFLQSRDM